MWKRGDNPRGNFKKQIGNLEEQIKRMIVFVGEAWGFEEQIEGRPFVGGSGRFLRAMIHESGISKYHLTNVFNFRPKNNDVKTLCTTSRANAIPGRPQIMRGKYIRKEYQSELLRLDEEITALQPDAVVALGATALWALTNETGIASNRGYPYEYKGIRVYGTWHPAAVLRQYELKPVLLADLAKARDCSPIPERKTFIPESVGELDRWIITYLGRRHFCAACDIETAKGQITCLGFAPTVNAALVIPIWDKKTGKSYWSLEDEIKVWEIVRNLCARMLLVGQNFSYDMTYLWKVYGIPTPKILGDTMIQHHALQPEMRKSLRFLGSLYTETLGWKHLAREEDDAKELD